MLGMGDEERSRGRPRPKWLDEICKETNLDHWRLITIARNREIGGSWSESSQRVVTDLTVQGECVGCN